VKKLIISITLSLMLVAVLAAPAIADDPIELGASVTVTEYSSVTITDTTPAGLDFGDLADGAVKQPEDASPAASITISAGSENNIDVNIELSGMDFSDGLGHSFDISNAYWNDADDSGTATALLETGTDTDTIATLSAGESADIYHWLSIPDGQYAGSYSSTFTYSSDALVINP
jgi:hypothetical protein